MMETHINGELAIGTRISIYPYSARVRAETVAKERKREGGEREACRDIRIEPAHGKPISLGLVNFGGLPKLASRRRFFSPFVLASPNAAYP